VRWLTWFGILCGSGIQHAEAFVDQRIGSGNTLVVFTADHGVAPLPELNQARKMPGGWLSEQKLRQKMTAALTRRFGPGEWLLPGSITTPYLNLSLVQVRRFDPAAVERTAADAARAEEHIARFYTRRELLNGAVQNDQIGAAASAGFYGSRSGDLFILREPYYLFEPTGTSHGTPYEYNVHVPLIFLGCGIKPGTYLLAVAINDVAPTLAALRGAAQPSGSIGRILNEMLAP
jgi:arylsulfatase A-like enzyme